jgi:hypothetical protein
MLQGIIADTSGYKEISQGKLLHLDEQMGFLIASYLADYTTVHMSTAIRKCKI